MEDYLEIMCDLIVECRIATRANVNIEVLLELLELHPEYQVALK